MRSLNRRRWLQLTSMALISESGIIACRPDPGPSLASQAPEPPRGLSAAAPPGEGVKTQPEEKHSNAPPKTKEAIVPPEALKKVYLQVLGKALPAEDVASIKSALNVFYRLEVIELTPMPLPKSAYFPPRSRYRAEKLLDFLKEQAPADSHVIMGLTSVDISTTKGQYEDWGILGLATVDGGQCVVSQFRAKRGARNNEHTRQRLAKTVVHEVGHTLGLWHCANHGCLMEDGKGSVKTTDHEYDLCDECRQKIAGFVQVRDVAQIPWPKPS